MEQIIKDNIRWINEIKKYTNETNDIFVIKYALSYTLQALRNNDENRYKWGKNNES